MSSVSVKQLCDFAARSGSLEFRYTPAPSSDEGMAGHRTVQERRPEPYLAEHPLSGVCEGLIVGGRVDGYFADDHACYLEEIKTHRGNLARIGPGKRDLHWAQLKVYGALFCHLHRRSEISLRLTYFEVRKEEEIQEDEVYAAEDLWQFLRDLCQRYCRWMAQETRHRQARDTALRTLVFPFGDFRGGQRSLSESVYKALSTNTPMLLQAPTGIGKTMGVLFPALHAMPVQQLDRVFYLTCRNTAKPLALSALERIVEHQPDTVPLRVLELTSLEQSCDHPDAACHGDSCPLAKGFFDKLDRARQEAAECRFLNADSLARIARKHDLCRYFLAQEMAQWSDVVVADVNHYFDQHALLYALTVEHEWRVVPVVDEAHNLIERARAMYSIDLNEAALLQTVRNPPAALQKPIQRLESAWNELVKPYVVNGHHLKDADYILDDVPEVLNEALYGLIAAVTDYLSDHHRAKDIQQILFLAIGFLRLAEKFGDHSLCTLRVAASEKHYLQDRGSAALIIDNLVPADHLEPRFKTACSVILFSATLSPSDYYNDLLGMLDNTVFANIPSPFRREQIDLRLITDISTRMDQRLDSMPALAGRIASQSERCAGNYLVFLSSFSYAAALTAYLQKKHPNLNVQCQSESMSALDRQLFIQFVSDERPSIGVCVLGGVFGEGVDLPGDKLIGVFIATLGLAPHDEKRERLKDVLEYRYGDGYNYTYLYPAITKVIQAAGRLIRSPDDRGVIELIDDRYRFAKIRKLLPEWWSLDSGDESVVPFRRLEKFTAKE